MFSLWLPLPHPSQFLLRRKTNAHIIMIIPTKKGSWGSGETKGWTDIGLSITNKYYCRRVVSYTFIFMHFFCIFIKKCFMITYTNTHTHTHYRHLHMRMHRQTLRHVHAYIFADTCWHAHMYSVTCTHRRTDTCTHTCTCIHAHTCTYPHTRTHAHTNKSDNQCCVW